LNLTALNKEHKRHLEVLYPAWDKGDVKTVEFMNQLNLKRIIKDYVRVKPAANRSISFSKGEPFVENKKNSFLCKLEK
jgi:hypothetical protein